MPLLRHHLARFSAKLFTIDSNRVSSKRKPSHDAKSGLAPPPIKVFELPVIKYFNYPHKTAKEFFQGIRYPAGSY
jgi:hypothetical protein